MLPRLAVVLFVLTPVAAHAQKGPEVIPFFGLKSGGSFRLGTDDESAASQRALKAQSSATGGVFFDYGLTENFQLEFLWAHQGTEVHLGPAPSTDPEAVSSDETPLFNLGVDYFHGGFVYGGGAGRFRPYVSAGIGTAVFNADLPDASRQGHLSFSVGLGFKSYFNDRLGFRFDVRAFGTRGGDRQQEVACGIFGCATFERASTFWQGHFIGGLVFSF